MKILLIEDEKITRITLANTMRKEGFEVDTSEDGADGLRKVQTGLYDVIITDLRLPKVSGLEILKEARELPRECPVIIITAFASMDTAIEALQNGAYDYIIKPFSPDTLLVRLHNLRKLQEVVQENTALKRRILSFEKRVLIGSAPETLKLIKMVELVAKRNTTVLIEGESGTGKELVARAIHHLSDRSNKPFTAFNCAVIPENLFESELFGHEKGAFSGAHRQHIGYFERAHKSTIFIDDIDDFPYSLQVKLLRVLQEREFERVGGQKPIHVDIRILAASKVSLWEMVQKKTFREDLYYRLNIVPVSVPSLRERKDDIPLLVEHFLDKYCAEEVARNMIPRVMNELMAYDWPGNVRELENIIQRMIAIPNMTDLNLSPEKEKLDQLPIESESVPNNQSTFPAYNQYMEEKDHQILLWALDQTSNNICNAAKLLQIPRSTLRSKIKKYGLELTS